MSNLVAAFNVVFAAAAVCLGCGIFIARRGTPLHRKFGYAYVTSMLILNVSALLLYARTGSFGPFHIAALISLATLLAGAIPAITRTPKTVWLALHWEFMSWSFVGLLAGHRGRVAADDRPWRYTHLPQQGCDERVHPCQASSCLRQRATFTSQPPRLSRIFLLTLPER
jgi:uncharacterized membrane protein